MIVIDKNNIKDFYKKVKKHLDEYMTFNVNPDKLRTYMQNDKNINRFISKCGLGDVSNIKRIILDVLDDICVRKIMKFESYVNLDIKDDLSNLFLFKESDLFEYEKVLSDYIRLSLSKINIVDNAKRLFTINNSEYIVLSNDDTEDIIKKISAVISKSVSNLKYKFNDIDLEVKRNQDISISIRKENNINNIIKKTVDIEYNSNSIVTDYKNYKIIKIK